MTDDDTCHIWVTERNELPRICGLIKEPRGDPRVPPIGRSCTGEDGVVMVFRHCLDIEDKHSLGISVMAGKIDVLAKA